MLYYLMAAILVLHTCFWGVGLAWCSLPRQWVRFWWVFAPALGMALQSAVVWFGAHLPVAGTEAYGRTSEIIPALLLAGGWWRIRGGTAATKWPGVRNASLAALLGAAVGWTLLTPMAQRGAWTLTSSSLGSCDHADYAACARTLQEFSKDDRTGFLGLPEVTRVRSTQYFFEYVVRQNHFTPAALIAHHGAVLGLRPHQLVSIMAVVLVLLNLPIVAFGARVLLGLRGRAPFWVAALYGLSPLTAYGVHHGALGQSLAAQGVALATLVAYAAARDAGRNVRAYFPLVLTAVWLMAGSYNFILVVAFAPAAALLALLAIWRRDAGAILRVSGLFGAALVCCAALFWGRFDGLADRFALFEKYDFGWPVTLLTPEAWLGLAQGARLELWPGTARIAALCGVIALALAGVMGKFRRDPRSALVAMSLVLPVAAGWCILAIESETRTNATYDAYKLLMVFYPGLLAGLLTWLGWWQGRRLSSWLAGVAAVGLLAANISAGSEFMRVMANPPLRVDGTTLQLSRLEREPRVASLNMQISRFWSRLWANALLLKKPQYFSLHTYEGRKDTELRGEWELSDSQLRSRPVDEGDIIVLNERFHAVRVGAPGRIRAEFGEGWHDREGPPNLRWRWCAGDGRVLLENPETQEREFSIGLRLRAVTPRVAELWLDDRKVAEWSVGRNEQAVRVDRIVLPAGRSQLILHSKAEPVVLPRDSRPLNIALFGMDIHALPASKAGRETK